MKTFVESQFGHCPLIWMFYSRKVTSLENLLKNYFKIHHKNIESLARTFSKLRKELLTQFYVKFFHYDL